MTLLEKDYLAISKKLLNTAHKDGIERNVVKITIKQDETVLMLKRSEQDSFPNLYELPGGGLRKDEDIFSAGKRELLEETSLLIREFISMSQVFDFNAASDKKKCRGYVFEVLPEVGEVVLNPNEHSEYKWITKDEVDNLPMLSNIRKIVKSILDS